MFVSVTILPYNKKIKVPAKTTLKFAIQLAGLDFEFPCGGEGICGKCKVRFLDNPPSPTETDKKHLSKNELDQGYRLACKCILEKDAIVEIPYKESLRMEKKVHMPSLKFTIDFPEDCQKRDYLCVDLGTTTITSLLMRNQIEKVWNAINPQVKFGSDIISRIAEAQKSNLRALKESVLDLIKKTPPHHFCAISISGNPVMQGIIKEEDLTSLAKYPFTKGRIKGKRIYTDFSEKGILVLPEIGGFLGGDALSLLCAAKKTTKKPFVALDIGTNTEIFLSDNNKILGTSTPAGPAFEGFNISCGMPFKEGAIFEVDTDLKFKSIGKPQGLCGTGLISAIYAFRKRKDIDETGRIKQDKLEILPGIYLTQEDVHNFQVAKSAIYASLKLMIKRSNEKIETIFIAGNFGAHLKKEWLTELKIIPEELKEAELIYLGNTSLWGAKWYLISSEAREYMENVADQVDIIYLSSESDFEDEFIKGILL